MKKIFIVSALLSCLALTGCGVVVFGLAGGLGALGGPGYQKPHWYDKYHQYEQPTLKTYTGIDCGMPK